MPRKKYKFYSEEFRTKLQQAGARGVGAQTGPRLPAGAATEVLLFIDGKRSIYDIYLGVRAEFGHVTTGSHEWKFAYVVTPATVDVDIEAVAAHVPHFTFACAVPTRSAV